MDKFTSPWAGMDLTPVKKPNAVPELPPPAPIPPPAPLPRSAPLSDPAAELSVLSHQSQLINAANANAEQAGSTPRPGAFGSLGAITGRTGGAL